MTSLRLFRRIEFLAPGREIRTVLDTTAAYFARKEPTKLTATVTYGTTAGQRREATMRHDLAVYRDIAYVTEGAAGA